jgi:hypothetical protein
MSVAECALAARPYSTGTRHPISGSVRAGTRLGNGTDPSIGETGLSRCFSIKGERLRSLLICASARKPKEGEVTEGNPGSLRSFSNEQ